MKRYWHEQIQRYVAGESTQEETIALQQALKDDAELRTIPTIILTTSGANEDVSRCYQLNANCYLTKPVEFSEFESLIKSVVDFWLMRARLPNNLMLATCE